jgi:hypothetical protein
MIWITEIKAVDPATGEVSTWAGPRIEANTKEDARNYCDGHGLGYCNIIGKLISEQNIVEQIIGLN